MPQAKRNLKVKRPSKVLSVAGIAGAFLASSTSRSMANVPPQSMAPFQALNLGEEEISDVTLATFHFVDGESQDTTLPRVQLARGGCGGGCGLKEQAEGLIVIHYQEPLGPPLHSGGRGRFLVVRRGTAVSKKWPDKTWSVPTEDAYDSVRATL